MASNDDKLLALVHYVIWRAGHREGFGATKLNKVLWFSDARHYERHGKSITGTSYVRQKHGPVPLRILAVTEDLEKAGLIRIGADRHFSKEMTRFVTDIRPDTSMFTDEELSIVDWWTRHIDEDHTAGSISELSHDYTWEIAGMGEDIPLYAVLASRIRAPRGKELEWAKAEAERLGLS